MADFAEQGALQPIDDLRDAIVENLGESVADVGCGRRHAVRRHVQGRQQIDHLVQRRGLRGGRGRAPGDVGGPVSAADTLKAAGITPYSVGVDVGWPITDIFENIYLRSAGPEMYDQLGTTRDRLDRPVREGRARRSWPSSSASDNMAGGTEGALQTEMPDSVAKVFNDSPEAAMVIIGDFAPGVTETTLEPETGYNVFDFPSVEGSDPAVMGAGDIFVKFTDNPAADAFLEYLTTVEAAEIWAERGGFTATNQAIDTAVYPDEITRATAGALAEAEAFKLRHVRPAAVGLRRNPRPGPVQALDRLRREPGRHRRDHREAGGRRRAGVRLRQHGWLDDERVGDDGGSPHAGASACGPTSRASGSATGSSTCSSAPRSCCSACGSSIRRSARSSGASSTGAATSSSGSTTTRRSSRTTRS